MIYRRLLKLLECSLLIAKAKKPHTIGELLIKPACIKIVEKLCGPQVAEKLKTVPLSNNTVKDRIDKMANNCEQQLVEKLRKGQFAIQLEETTKDTGKGRATTVPTTAETMQKLS